MIYEDHQARPQVATWGKDAVTLPTRILGRTGVEVPVLGYGAMELRGSASMGGPALSDEEAGWLLNQLVNAGVTLIDTSIDYGHSEELIGRHLSSRRDEFFLASKCGCPLSLPPGELPTPDTHDFSAANVRAGVEQSLARLQTDHLDLVQVHLSPSRAELETSGTIDELDRLRAEGKVRFIGMSGTLPNLPDQIEMGVFDVFQIPYSALQPEHDELISRAAYAGAGVLIRGGTARGTASEDKNWTVQPLSSSGPAAQDRWQAAKLDDLLDGMNRHEFILRFTLSHPGLSTTIVGTSQLEHLRSNVAIASRGPLPEAVYGEARRRLGLAPA
jgi:aryl-alcohol dehydrogenase-like predicted oxidoreductase